MSVPAWVVLGATALVSSPLVPLVADGSVPLQTAVERALICLVVSWAVLTVVARLAFAPLGEQPAPPTVADEAVPLPGPAAEAAPDVPA